MARNQKRYTDEERAQVVAMLKMEGYPDTLGALTKVAKYAKVHPDVLRRWWKGTQNPPPDTLVVQKKKELREAIKDELSEIFAAMNSKREDASYRDLGTVAGILFDKQQLLNEQPTERIAHEHSGTLTVDERRQRITDILDAARSRRTSGAAGSGIRTDD